MIKCGAAYYPSWSSRGIRAVYCERPARFTTTDPNYPHPCGIHVKRASGKIRELENNQWAKKLSHI